MKGNEMKRPTVKDTEHLSETNILMLFAVGADAVMVAMMMLQLMA